MPHYTEITKKLRSVHATNVEAAALIEELVVELDKAKEMLLEAREAYTTETQSTIDLVNKIMSLEATIETYKEQLTATETSARNLMHYAKGLPGHVPVSGHDVSTRNEMLKTHEDLRDFSEKWEELCKALGAHGPESDPLTGKDTTDDIHARAMAIIYGQNA